MKFKFETPQQQVDTNNTREWIKLLETYADMMNFIVSNAKNGIRIGCDAPPRDASIAEFALVEHTHTNISARRGEV